MCPNGTDNRGVDLKRISIHVGIVTILVFGSWGISSIAYWHASGIAANWTGSLQPQLRMSAASTDKFCTPPSTIHGLEEVRLEDDFRELRGRMEHHLNVMMYFYANFFRAIVMTSMIGAIAGICLFYIANKGWSTANNFVITAFVISTVIAAYFLSIITVFKVQENISDNKVLYLQYVAIGNNLLTYCATGTTDDESIKSEDQYIRQVDKQMATINDIAIGFDYTKIADYRTLLATSTQNKQQSPREEAPTNRSKNTRAARSRENKTPASK